jgi:two-component system, OmpR family, response regulator
MHSTKTILVVDDNAQLQAAMKLVLDCEGYQTLTAADGEQALNIIRQTSPDLIFLDMFMPGMDGWAFLDAYYRKPGRRAPIVGISGEIMHPDELPGVDSFMRKPYSTEQMLTLVHRYMEHR